MQSSERVGGCSDHSWQQTKRKNGGEEGGRNKKGKRRTVNRNQGNSAEEYFQKIEGI